MKKNLKVTEKCDADDYITVMARWLNNDITVHSCENTRQALFDALDAVGNPNDTCMSINVMPQEHLDDGSYLDSSHKFNNLSVDYFDGISLFGVMDEYVGNT